MFWVMMISPPAAVAVAELVMPDVLSSEEAASVFSSGTSRRRAPRDSRWIGTRKELAACMAANADSGLVITDTSGERERNGCGSFCGRGASDTGLTCGAYGCGE